MRVTVRLPLPRDRALDGPASALSPAVSALLGTTCGFPKVRESWVTRNTNHYE